MMAGRAQLHVREHYGLARQVQAMMDAYHQALRIQDIGFRRDKD
jgi:hypothetical protein